MVQYNMEVIGFSDGFTGLIEKDFRVLTESDLSGLLTMGGTILGTSREKPYKRSDNGLPDFDKPKLIKQHYEELDLNGLVILGGNGTMKTAAKLAESGLNVIGLPKTIDNDVWGTDVTFGFYSAVDIATEAIDRLHSTANSHKRIMVIELMGHDAGWISLYAGVAGGGDIILIPEIEYNEQIIARTIENRARKGKPYSIVVVAEGIRRKKEKRSAASHIARLINKATGLEARETILGYIQRGGTPSPYDRLLATRYGTYAAKLAAEERFGFMVGLKGDGLVPVPLSEVGGKLKLVEPDNQLVKKARFLGTSFGDDF
jgi:6-phosphofructokinase 1